MLMHFDYHTWLQEICEVDSELIGTAVSSYFMSKVSHTLAKWEQSLQRFGRRLTCWKYIPSHSGIFKLLHDLPHNVWVM